MMEAGGSCYTNIVTRRLLAVIERDPEFVRVEDAELKNIAGGAIPLLPDF